MEREPIPAVAVRGAATRLASSAALAAGEGALPLGD
jgi:hypothetical protein